MVVKKWLLLAYLTIKLSMEPYQKLHMRLRNQHSFTQHTVPDISCKCSPCILLFEVPALYFSKPNFRGKLLQIQVSWWQYTIFPGQYPTADAGSTQRPPQIAYSKSGRTVANLGAPPAAILRYRGYSPGPNLHRSGPVDHVSHGASH